MLFSFKYSTTKHLAAFSQVLILLILPVLSHAQESDEYDSLLNEYAELDSILLAEIENDSSSLLSLLDEILAEDYLKSQFSVRLGYTSDITNAGRNYGVQQFGLNAGLAYYHKSGVFADIAGYYNSDQDPKYNTTITTLGYMGMIKTKWNYYLSYDHYFYNQPQNSDYIIDYPLTNSINTSINFLHKGISIGNDYSFLFGDETAHRIRLNLGYSHYFMDVGFIDRIGVNPIMSVLAGNANVTTTVFTQEIAQDVMRDLIQQMGRRRFLELYKDNPDLLNEMLSVEQTKNTFGIMNYSLFLPLSFSIKNTTLLLNYSLNFPIALLGETDLDTTPNSYFSATFLHTFSF